MPRVTTAQIKAAWASAAAQLPSIPPDRLQYVLSDNDTHRGAPFPKSPAVLGRGQGAGDLLQQLLPLVVLLEKSSHEGDAFVSPVVKLLRDLQGCWSDEEREPWQVHALMVDCMWALKRFVWSQYQPEALKAHVSKSVKEVLAQALVLAAAQLLDNPVLFSKTSCGLLLRCLTRTSQFHSQPLPLLSVDALGLLEELVDNITGMVSPPQLSPRAVQDDGMMGRLRYLTLRGSPLWSDERTFLLLAGLVRSACRAPSPSTKSVLYRLVRWSTVRVEEGLEHIVGQRDEAITPVHKLSTRSMRALARLAALCVDKLIDMSPSPSSESSTSEVHTHVKKLVDLMLDVADTSIKFAQTKGSQDPRGDRVLLLAAHILQDGLGLLGAPVPRQLVSTLASRLRTLQAAAARLVHGAGDLISGVNAAGHVEDAGVPPVADPINGSMGESGANGLASDRELSNLNRKISELQESYSQEDNSQPGSAWDWDVLRPLTTGMADLGNSNDVDPVPGSSWLCRALTEALVRCLQSSWSLGQATVMAALVSPSSTTEMDQEQMAQAGLLGRLFVALGEEYDLARLLIPSLTEPLVGARSAASSAVWRFYLQILRGVAVASAQQQDSSNLAFHQVSQLLVKLYKDPPPPVLPRMPSSCISQCGPGSGADNLAVTLTHLAAGVAGARPRIQADLRLKLLTLFSDVAYRLGSTSTKSNSPRSVVDLGALLLPLATAFKGYKSSRMKEYSVGRFSLSTPQADDLSIVTLFRNLWLYCGLYRLVHLGGTAAAHKDVPNSVLQEWAASAGQLATVTPLLVVGADSYNERDMVEELKAEFDDKLLRVGAAAQMPVLSTALMSIVMLASQPPSLPTDLVKVAYLYGVACLEVSRSALGPFPEPGEAAPLHAVLAYLQISDPTGSDAKWYKAIAERCFQAYLSRLISSRGFVPDPFLSEQDVGGNVRKHAEALAMTLLSCLSFTSGHVEGTVPLIVEVADRMLGQLLAKFESLYYSEDCLRLLFDLLEQEEGDKPLGSWQATSNLGQGVIWRWLTTWVKEGARRAPTFTEALLQRFLTASNYTNGQAAFRRAGDLLKLTVTTRPSSLASGGHQAHSPALTLVLKQFHSGVVEGMKYSSEEAGGGCPGLPEERVGEKVISELEDLLKEYSKGGVPAPHTEKLLFDRYLSASSLLATSTEASGVYLSQQQRHHLMKLICTAHLYRFTPGFTKAVVFCWSWILSSAPHLSVALVSQVVSAWIWSVDKRMGIFTRDEKDNQDARGVGDSSADGDDLSPPSATSRTHKQQLTAGIEAHHLWLNFLLELWTVMAARSDLEAYSIQKMFGRLLTHSLRDPNLLCSHPASVGPRFRLLLLGLSHARLAPRTLTTRLPSLAKSSIAKSSGGSSAGSVSGIEDVRVEVAGLGGEKVDVLSRALLHDRVLKVGLWWFAQPPAWYAGESRRQAEEQCGAVKEFLDLLMVDASSWSSLTGALVNTSSAKGTGDVRDHPVWTYDGSVSREDLVKLLGVLVNYEYHRLKVWAQPLKAKELTFFATLSKTDKKVRAYVRTSWQVHPQLAVSLLAHFPSSDVIRDELTGLVRQHAFDSELQQLPLAAMLLASCAEGAKEVPELSALNIWAPASAVEGLELMSSPAGKHSCVQQYAVRCLLNTPPSRVVFFLPQLVQMLRTDSKGGHSIETFFREMSRRSRLFSHQLIWALSAEEKPPPEAFDPIVKRSGWQAPQDTGLWGVAARVKTAVLTDMTADDKEYYNQEDEYFRKVTNLSGYLYEFEKEQRRGKLVEALGTFQPEARNLYIPTNPECRVIRHIPESGACMQSAAKVPILVAFEVDDQEQQKQRKIACIFKVGDDIRQDVLALQVIKVLKDAFDQAGLPLYLRPYGCLPTGYECGIIEVVPNCKSRAALGELSDHGLLDIFQIMFGIPGTPTFERARECFIVSEAGYAIASYLLQAKDRHNGNIMIDNEGHLVHIDFGFILEISPGGNLGFESAAFKLSKEMTQLLDPGGLKNSPSFQLFEELCIRGYLAARTVAEPIIALVALMAESGLPCYGRGKPVSHLRRRFHLELTDAQAAVYMRGLIADAYDRWNTNFYDYIQAAQNKIPY